MPKVNVRDFRDSLANAIMVTHGCSSKYDGKEVCIVHKSETFDGVCMSALAIANDSILATKEFNKLAEPEEFAEIEYSLDKINPADAILSNSKKVAEVAEVIYNTGTASTDKNWEDIGRQRQAYFIRRTHTVIAEVFAD